MTTETTRSVSKWRFILLCLSVGLVGSFLLNISFGSVNIPLTSVIDYFYSGDAGNASWNMILHNFRLPKAITALLVGGALGISGMQMQTLFRNPLAGPYVLGITSGAGLGVALAIFLGFMVGGVMDMSGISRSWLLVACGGAGSFLVLLTIGLVANRIRDSVSLLIIGLMFGAAAGAVVSILQFISKAEHIQAYVMWSFGSLGSLSWVELSVFVPILVVGLIAALALSKPLNMLLLGENYAASMGLNLKKTRMLIILNTSVLAGAVTAFCGPIAFVGIALPHLTRMLFQTTNHLLLAPLIILMGGIFMLLLDMVSQLPGMQEVLPINAVTSLFGAPFVIYLLLRKKNNHFMS